MVKKKTSENIQVGPSAPGWMVTYGDLMTQLLIFFVMMFALASAMNEMQLITLKNKMQEYINREDLGDDVSMKVDERGLVLSFHGPRMYDKGEDKIKPAALKAVRNLAAFVRPQPNDVRIEGHTDFEEASEKYPSHWDLASARATYIASQLVDTIYFPPYRLSSSGYADQKPYLEKDSPTYKMLEKRRADLLKTASLSFLNEAKKMIMRNIVEQVIEKREYYNKKYKLKPDKKIRVKLAVRKYKEKLERKYDEEFIKIRKMDKFKDRLEKWYTALGSIKFKDDELEILAAKEDYIKAKFYEKFQKEIIKMGNLSPAQQDRNRRVDIIVARISQKDRKKRLL